MHSTPTQLLKQPRTVPVRVLINNYQFHAETGKLPEPHPRTLRVQTDTHGLKATVCSTRGKTCLKVFLNNLLPADCSPHLDVRVATVKVLSVTWMSRRFTAQWQTIVLLTLSKLNLLESFLKREVFNYPGNIKERAGCCCSCLGQEFQPLKCDLLFRPAGVCVEIVCRRIGHSAELRSDFHAGLSTMQGAAQKAETERPKAAVFQQFSKRTNQLPPKKD